MNRLAILDWGIGGFGFWKAWKLLRPNEGALYFSDSGFTPYGKVANNDLINRLNEVITNLHRDHQITHCLIACHSASTVASQLNCPGVTISGITEGTASFIRETIPPGPISITGGQRTITSQTYPRLLPDYDIKGLIAQPLSAAVEAGTPTGPELHTLVRETLAETTDHLVLACTHYIALEKVIQAEFPEVIIHDPIPEIAQKISQTWPAMEPGDLFLTTGSHHEFQQSANLAFGVQIP